MKSLFPELIDGYSIQDSITYNPETIFDYIDGAGEVYLSYGFRNVTVVYYIQSGRPNITAEIFDMGRPADAFGIFSFSRESEEAGIGNGSEFRGSLLKFWKGKYYISIQTEEIDEDMRQIIRNLAARIDSQILEQGQKPELVSLLPQENLIPHSEIYFHLFPVLNNIYFIAETNILNLDKTTDAVLARYQPGAVYLLVINYKSSEKADTAYRNFLGEHMKEPAGMVQTENGKWTGLYLVGQYLVIIFDSPDKEEAEGLLKKSKNLLMK